MEYEFELTEFEFGLLRDLIHRNFGLLFKESKRSFMQMKLYSQVRGLGLKSYREYIDYLTYNDPRKCELTRMIAAITNNETYFFREMPQLNHFRTSILPSLREQKQSSGDNRIRILSLGCSTGEEVYTLAMLLFESGLFCWGWDCQIIGFDVNIKAIEHARKGSYYERSLRMTNPPDIQRFFVKNCESWSPRDSIRKLTTFMSGNIIDRASWNGLSEIDVIFCRNVLIYFSESMVQSALEQIHRVLRPRGYLFLGFSEILPLKDPKFDLVRCPNTLIYRKKEQVS
jgi:chemotaxis protein methyltransferase CheR